MSHQGRRGRTTRIHPYLSEELAERLGKYCVAARMTESAAVEAALQQYLDRTSDFTLVLQRLDRLGRALARAHRDLEFQSEAFAVFVKVWFANTPPVAADQRKAAQSSAEARYQQFVRFVSAEFSVGRRLLDESPREDVANEEELLAASGASTVMAQKT